MVERLAHNERIVGSIPTAPNASIDDWLFFEELVKKCQSSDNPWLNYTNDAVFRVAVTLARRLNERQGVT